MNSRGGLMGKREKNFFFPLNTVILWGTCDYRRERNENKKDETRYHLIQHTHQQTTPLFDHLQYCREKRIYPFEKQLLLIA
jgi:hypothetical protein